MKRLRRYAYELATLLAAALLCSSALAAAHAPNKTPPHLTKSVVLLLAQKKAMSVVGTLQHYDAPRVKYHADTQEWQVSYAGKGGGIDNCFLIFVNDNTKEAWYLACG